MGKDIGEDMGEDIGSYLEGERKPFLRYGRGNIKGRRRRKNRGKV